MSKRIISLLILIFTFSIFTAGCGATGKQADQTNKSAAKKKEVLTVAAAADLTKAFTDIENVFEKQNNCDVQITYGSTGTSLEQIKNGAPYDVFAAANISAIEELKQKEMIFPDTQELYAIGRIGTATKVGSSIKVKNLQDLTKPEIKKIAIANPEHAPYGLAAKQALESVGLWDKVKNKLVYGKNIQDTLTLITTGNAEAGIIALSIYDKNEVTFTLIDNNLHKPLQQSIAVVKPTQREQLARKFIKFVNSKEGRQIMIKYGFTLPNDNN